MAQRRRSYGDRDDDLFRCRLTFDNRAAANQFIRQHQPDVIETERDKDRITHTVLLDQKSIKMFTDSGLRCEVLENASALGRERQKEVGRGDRFEGGRIPPRGLGEKVRRKD